METLKSILAASVKAAEIEVDPMAPEAPEMPEEPSPEMPAPKFNVGDKVSSPDRGVGEVVSEAASEACYKVKYAGGEYLEPESGLMASDGAIEPAPAAEPIEPVTPEVAPLGEVAVALGLSADASSEDVLGAIKALRAENDSLVGDKSEAIKAAGFKPDLQDFGVAALTRQSGKTWTQAVDALRAARPSLFESAAPVATTEATAETVAAATLELITVEPVKVPAAARMGKNGALPVAGLSDEDVKIALRNARGLN